MGRAPASGPLRGAVLAVPRRQAPCWKPRQHLLKTHGFGFSLMYSEGFSCATQTPDKDARGLPEGFRPWSAARAENVPLNTGLNTVVLVCPFQKHPRMPGNVKITSWGDNEAQGSCSGCCRLLCLQEHSEAPSLVLPMAGFCWDGVSKTSSTWKEKGRGTGGWSLF